MRKRVRRLTAGVIGVWCVLGGSPVSSAGTVTVEPTVTRAIEGIEQFERKKYINLAADTGAVLDALDAEKFRRYFVELGIHLGRRVNLLHAAWSYENAAYEDPNRPGYVDLDRLAKEAKPPRSKWDRQLRQIFPEGADLVGTENFLEKTWPPFMETYFREEDTKKHHPMVKNPDAAAEAMIAYLKVAFDDWSRPRWFEGLNEPDWFFNVRNDESFFGLHEGFLKYGRASGLDMKIGGPCFPTAQYFKKNYQALPGGMGHFIKQTGGKLDFYSFHPYNYMRWDEQKRDFFGRITGGLPMDADLDALSNYTFLEYGQPVKVVISEHGGYLVNPQLGNEQMDRLAKELFPDLPEWEREMKRRAFTDYLMVSGAISHTLTFMDHPHIVEKAIPYIQLQTLSWKPDHYATLIVSKGYQRPAKEWVETRMVDFYEYFKGVKGRRVNFWCDDPDVQTQAFVDGSKLYLLFNNLAKVPQEVTLDLKGADRPVRYEVRRLSRNQDYTPNFRVERVSALESLSLAPLEAVAVVARYDEPIPQAERLNETIHYGDRSVVEIQGKDTATFRINVPDVESARDATLRIAVGRGVDTDHDVAVLFNGKRLKVPLEDAAPYLEDKRSDGTGDYGALKRVRVPVEWLRENNRVVVAFPDGKGGGVGSVVLRVARPVQTR